MRAWSNSIQQKIMCHSIMQSNAIQCNSMQSNASQCELMQLMQDQHEKRTQQVPGTVSITKAVVSVFYNCEMAPTIKKNEKRHLSWCASSACHKFLELRNPKWLREINRAFRGRKERAGGGACAHNQSMLQVTNCLRHPAGHTPTIPCPFSEPSTSPLW